MLFLFISFGFSQVHAQDTTLKEYVGKYLFPEGSVVPSADITLADSILTVNSVQGSSELVKTAKDTFSVVTFNGMAYFKRDGNGKVSGVRVEVGDVLLEGTKEPGSALLRRKPEAALLKKIAAK